MNVCTWMFVLSSSKRIAKQVREVDRFLIDNKIEKEGLKGWVF